MLNPRFIEIFLVGLMVLGAGAIFGQDYPNKPVRILTSNPGGTNDFMARIIAQGLAGPLGQQVIVDNRGGGSFISAEVVAKAPPDGYTVLSTDARTWTASLITKNAYDPVKDLAPITLMASAPLFLVVHPSLPVKSVKELIALAKARPGELNSDSGGIGGAPHLAAELFKAMTSVPTVHINYGSSRNRVGKLRW